MRKTKIVCTIGPVSNSPEILEQLMRAGMNVARLNFSHGTLEDHGKTINKIRRIADELDRPVAILQDLAGPKIRIGEIKDSPITLEPEATFTITNRQVPGDKNEVSVNYHDLPQDVNSGDTLLLSDGALEMEVIETNDQDIKCRVIVGGTLSSRKGITLTTGTINAPIMADKDRSDLAFGIEQGVDYVALSFVRNAKDVLEVRKFMEERGSAIPLIAKIEKHEALQNIDEIIKVVDGIMVARGDLGVETPLEKIPRVQKMLIEKANQASKPAIAATQMLLSMVNSPRPTRAEVTDVANAIFDGASGVMLSEESAAGKYPVKAVEIMSKIAEDAESGFNYDVWIQRLGVKNLKDRPDEGVSLGARNLAENIQAGHIVTFTHSGSTARLVSKYRPRQSILAVTPMEETYRRLALIWGVIPILVESAKDIDDMMDKAYTAVLNAGLVKRGETVVITAGIPVGEPGNTNLINVRVVK